MEKLLVIVFDSESQADAGSQALDEMHAEGSLALYAAAVIVKGAGVEARLKRTARHETQWGLLGPLVGGLVGLLGGPVGALAGVTGGWFYGTMHEFVKTGVREDFVNDVAQYLQPGRAAVVAVVDEQSVLPVDTRMEALGGRVFRQPCTDVEGLLLERDVTALAAELAALKEERGHMAGEATARLQESINVARQKLQTLIDQAKARDQEAQRVAEAKVRSLTEQVAAVQGGRKTMLQERAARVRAEHNQRSARLRQAWERAEETLPD